MTTRRRPTSEHGFTLIEVMMVLAILSVLVAVALPAFIQAQFRARQAEVPVVLGLLRTAKVSYYATHDCYMDVNPNPPVAPTLGVPAPFDNTITGAAPCSGVPLNMADLDIDIGAPVYHQYACSAVVAAGGDQGYACDAVGDLDGDGVNSLWVTCSDSDDDDVCDGPSPNGAVAPIINSPVRVSAERF